MSLKGFTRVHSNDQVLNRLQNNIEQFSKPLIDSEIIDGRLISGVAITSGTAKSVDHGLGRKLSGWIVVGRNANAQVWDSQSTNKISDKTLILNSSATVTVSLWVF